MSKRKPRLPATEIEMKMIKALSQVTFLPGSGDKKFYRSIKDDTWLTIGQIDFLKTVFERYRRQITNYEDMAEGAGLYTGRHVKLTFVDTLFGKEPIIEVKEKLKDRWTKRDRLNNQ